MFRPTSSMLNGVGRRSVALLEQQSARGSSISNERSLFGTTNKNGSLFPSSSRVMEMALTMGGYQHRQPMSKQWIRAFSSGSNKENTKKDGEDSQELVLTPGQKVVAGTRLTMWAGIFVFASACAYYIGRELLPTKMSPNTIFDKSLELVRNHAEVQKRFGTPLKGYGRDHGGHREGRRNFVEHTEYTNQEDDTKRTRVRYNLEGPYGHAFVFAEQASNMAGGEFVYVLVQDKANGRVINVVDNRSAMAVKRMAGGSKEGQEAFGNLLTGGGAKK